jgi:uncharacterized protein YkwD
LSSGDLLEVATLFGPSRLSRTIRGAAESRALSGAANARTSSTSSIETLMTRPSPRPKAAFFALAVLLTSIGWIVSSTTRAARPPRALRARVNATKLLRQHIQRRLKTKSSKLLKSERRLDAVAADNSAALAEVGGQVPSGALSYLRFGLHKRQVHDAVLRAVVLRYSQGALPRLPETLRREAASGRFTHLGIGIAPLGQEWIATVVLLRRSVELAPLTKRRHFVRLCGRVTLGHAPSVLLTEPSGQVRRRRVKVKRRRFCIWLPARRAGRYQLEVMVQGRFGPEVAALFPIYVDVPAPARPRQRLYPRSKRGTAQLELELLKLVNGTRRTARLPLLAFEPALARVARRHSHDMSHRGFFGHVSPRFGGLQRRLAAAGLGHLAASENLALATSARRAHDSLLDSPSHRAILLDPRLRAAGIGIVRGRGGLLYITECFRRR